MIVQLDIFSKGFLSAKFQKINFFDHITADFLCWMLKTKECIF